jgi:hypothetical protein
MNIFQEIAIASWLLMKIAFFSLTVIGAKVVWDKYGHHAKSLSQLSERRINGVYKGNELDDELDAEDIWV